MILGVEGQSSLSFSTQMSDNLRNVILSLKQVNLRQTDSLFENVLEFLYFEMCKVQSDHVKLYDIPKQNKEILKHISKCISLYC